MDTTPRRRRFPSSSASASPIAAGILVATRDRRWTRWRSRQLAGAASTWPLRIWPLASRSISARIALPRLPRQRPADRDPGGRFGQRQRGWSAVHDALAATTRTAPTIGPGAGGATRARGTPSPTPPQDLRAVSTPRARPDPTSWSGHSLGGAYGRVFAGTDRAEMAGLVLVDAFNPDLESAWIHPLLGTLRGEYQTRLDGLRAHVSQVDGLDWVASEAQLRAALWRACRSRSSSLRATSRDSTRRPTRSSPTPGEARSSHSHLAV